jgi:hypothetical protein
MYRRGKQKLASPPSSLPRDYVIIASGGERPDRLSPFSEESVFSYCDRRGRLRGLWEGVLD